MFIKKILILISFTLLFVNANELENSKKLCNDNNGSACDIVGYYYQTGKGVKQDLQKAVEYYQKSCTTGYTDGCYNLAVLYEKVPSVQNYEKAFKIYEDLCYKQKDGGACNSLAIMYDAGKGIKKDHEKSMAILDKSCELDYADGCFWRGFFYHKESNTKQSTKFFTKACSLGNQKACQILKKNSTATNTIKNYEQGCKNNNPQDCYELGVIYFQLNKPNYEKSIELYEKACNANVDRACYNLGSIYYRGVGTSKNIEKAKKFYEKVFDSDEPKLCYNFGVMFATGKVFKQNKKKALNYFQKACQNGSDKACGAYQFWNKKL